MMKAVLKQLHRAHRNEIPLTLFLLGTMKCFEDRLL